MRRDPDLQQRSITERQYPGGHGQKWHLLMMCENCTIHIPGANFPEHINYLTRGVR